MRKLALVAPALLAALLIGTPVAAQQDITDPGVAPAGAGVVETYRQNRQAARDAIASISAELDQLGSKESELINQIAELDRQASPGTVATDSFTVLRVVSAVTDRIVSALFYPLIGLISTAGNVGSLLEIAGAESLKSFARTAISYLLPVTFILSVLFVRRFHNEMYLRYRAWIIRLAIILAVILPLSAHAEEAQEAPEPTLDELFGQAEDVLALTPVQRYLRDLEQTGDKPVFYQIPNLDLSGGSLNLYQNFTIGTGEHYFSMAAMYEADGQPEKMIEQLGKLSDSNLRFTNKANADSVLFKAIKALILNDRNEIAANLLEAHADQMRSIDDLLALHSMFYDRSLSVSANSVANRMIEVAVQTPDLIRIAGELYRKGDTNAAQDALLKAVKNSRNAEEISSALKLSLAKNDTDAILAVLDRGPKVLGDTSEYFRIADQLAGAERREETDKIIESLINEVDNSNRILVNGVRMSKVSVLSAISTECFERGLFDSAEDSANKIFRIIPRSKLSALIMRPPSSQKENIDLPDSAQLVAPLYYGMLKEAMGAQDTAEQLYKKETSEALRTIIDSNGLEIPRMLNHLSLLGKRLIEKGDNKTLANLDRVMVKLETLAQESRRNALAPAIEARRTSIQQLNQTLTAKRVNPNGIAPGNHTEEPGFFSLAYSAIFLTLRVLLLLVFLYVIYAAVISISLKYSRQFPMQRYYAFVSRMIENFGWVYVFTILMAPVGLVMILVGQSLQLKQLSWHLPLKQESESS